ncbi:ATP10 protein-domain-containing protein [Rhexocercosporidium sp. MPI-PUGE-AT-0058]|nr:ATP10 protein-domain-containing protein [Rhexocercosporidium sp. MPI-PUGE-AT-0058]
MIISRRPFRPSNFQLESKACLLCQWRTFSTSYRRQAEKGASSPATPAVPESPLADAPRAYGKAVSEFTPKPLGRPIGLPYPPQAGENAGVDSRTWKQRRDDFVDYDKHLVRRKQLTQKISTPYFREWSNMRLHKGKSFLAPPRLFKGERALHFPNLQGQTLSKDKIPKDTTPVFEDKVSIVSVFSSVWAESQAATFASEKDNPELHEVVRGSGGLAQMVQINIEENALKAMLIKLFMPSLRKRIGEGNWGRYFVVRKGVSDDIRDAIGLLNSKVGYTYLLDGECRIRWAGSGPCEGDEKEGLVKGAKRLIEELKVRRKEKAILPPKVNTGKTVENQTAAAAA